MPGPGERGGRSPEDAARRAADRLLARAPRSEEEVRRTLRRRHDPCEIDKVVADLRAAGALDDRRTARDWIAYRNEVRPSGRARLQADLARRGFPPEVIRDTLEEFYRDRNESDDLERALDRMLPDAAVPGDPGERRRLAGRLARRGFRAETIWERFGSQRAAGERE